MKTIYYRLTLLEPLRITSNSSGKSDEMDTISYISGSSVGGAVASKLLDKMENKSFKTELLMNTVFSNAYPEANGRILFPAPLGFYENKSGTGDIENILFMDEPTPGNKRASLGEYCYFDGNTVFGLSVKKQDALGINVAEQGIFRKVIISKNQVFVGSIETELDNEILKALSDATIRIGGNKSSGYGLCKVEVLDGITTACKLPERAVSEVTMILISDTAMRNGYGEICGLDEKTLAEKFGVEQVEIKKAATAVVKKSGVNRTWGVRTPEYTMYKAGSAFLLKFSEPVSPEKLAEVSSKGIGVGINEGYGKVLFTDTYADIKKKETIISSAKESVGTAFGLEIPKDESTAKLVAKRIARERIRKAELDFISKNNRDLSFGKSQLGIALNLSKNAAYNLNEAKKTINDYIEHEEEKLSKEKRQMANSSSKSGLLRILKLHNNEGYFKIIGFDSKPIMGYSLSELFTERELRKMSYDLLVERIIYHNRKSKNGIGAED